MDTSDLYTKELETNELKGDTKPIELDIDVSGEVGKESQDELEDNTLGDESIPVDYDIDTGGEIGDIEDFEPDDTAELITGRSVGEEIRNTPINLSDDIEIYEGDNKIDFQKYQLKNIKAAVDDDDVVNLGQLKDTIESSVDIVQTVGNSETALMSQKATTGMVYASTDRVKIAIGATPTATGNYSTSIGRNPTASANYSIAIGTAPEATGSEAIAIGGNNSNRKALATGANSIAIGGGASASASNAVAFGRGAIASEASSFALGSQSTTTRQYEVVVGSGTSTHPTRYVANVTDPELAQDAATKNYVDSMYPVGCVYLSTSSTAPTFVGTWTSIGSQTIGSSTVYYYERTA